ncbi:Ribosomal protein L10P [Perkinsus sp. BL_2016]|nr:Ribosomal protein L10P [Perkinsus sp. BL_2016]
MGKNTMVRKAMKEAVAENSKLEALLPLIRGNVGLVFTNGDLCKVRDAIISNRVQAPAKVGLTAQSDIFIPAGSTGMDPNKTSFFQALGISTKVVKGAIEIVSEVCIVKTGQKVGASQAALMQMLNLMPFHFGMTVLSIYDDGAIFEPSILDITPESLVERVQETIKKIAALSLEISFPTVASAPHSLVNAYKRILGLALARKVIKGLKSAGKLVQSAASSGALGPDVQLLSAAVKTAIVAGKDIAAGKSLATIAKDASKTAEQEALNAATGGGKEEFLASVAVSAGAPPAAVGVIQGGSVKEQMKQQAVNMAEAQVANQINANPSVVPVVPLPVLVPVAQVAPVSPVPPVPPVPPVSPVPPVPPVPPVLPVSPVPPATPPPVSPYQPGQIQQGAVVNPIPQSPGQLGPMLPVITTTVNSTAPQQSQSLPANQQSQFFSAAQQSQIFPAAQQLPPATQFQQFPGVQQVKYSATGLPLQAATYPVTVQQPQSTVTVPAIMQGTMYPVQQQQQLFQQAYPAAGQYQQAIQPQYYQSQPAA